MPISSSAKKKEEEEEELGLGAGSNCPARYNTSGTPLIRRTGEGDMVMVRNSPPPKKEEQGKFQKGGDFL